MAFFSILFMQIRISLVSFVCVFFAEDVIEFHHIAVIWTSTEIVFVVIIIVAVA